MKNVSGYPLPEGEAFTEEMECAIIYYPAKPEYRQALLGSISFLATWRAWQRDTDKRGKDAALAWSNALEFTMGCWNMACIETLITNQEWMIEWMATHSLDCCEGTTWGDTTIIITVITPFIGEPPGFYGETAVSDWEEWGEHLCFNAHAWVDLLIANALVLEEAGLAGGIGMGLLASALAAIAFIGTGGLLAIPVIMLGASALVSGFASDIFSDAADDLEAAREDIVCALMLVEDVGLAVETALGSGLAWDLFFSILDYDTPTAILYEGEGQDGYLSSETSDACDCEEPDQLNGWLLQNQQNSHHDRTKSHPSCEYWNWELWTDFLKPEGAPHQNGTLTVRGNVLIDGVYEEYPNCAGAGSIDLDLWVCAGSTPSPPHSCSVTINHLKNQTGGIPNPVNWVIPFEYIRSISNTQSISVGVKSRWRYGNIDLYVTAEVNFIEVT